MGPNGKCIPGTSLEDVNDIVTYTFDDQHRIIGYEDWWEPGTIEKLDFLAQRARQTSTVVMTNSYESASVQSTGGYGTAMVGAFITCLSVCALSKGCYDLG